MAAATRVTLGQHSLAKPNAVNQDFHGAMLPEGALRASKGIAVALADGIGSSRVSQIASAAAVRGFLDDYYATSDAWSVRRAAQRVLAATNSWLHAQTMRSDARFDKDSGYVCTFSALVLKGRDMHLLHVGDSRVYRLHAHALEPLTEDHRVHLSSVESYLGRALGAGPNVEIDYRTWEAEVGDVYLLATDGAWSHLDAAAVHDAIAQCGDDFDAAAQQLAMAARARGSNDDATVQLLRIDALPASDASALHPQREGLAIPPMLMPRDRFEGFTVVRELHASARSHVLLAVDDATGQQAVLKLPSVDLRDDPAYLDGFVREEWVARRVDSAHVLKASPVDRVRTHLFVAMEYVKGQTLAQWMVDHPNPTLDSVRGIVDQLAKGLQALHRREMLHQDLRPENDDRPHRHGEDHRPRIDARRRPERHRAGARGPRHRRHLAVHRAGVLHRPRRQRVLRRVLAGGHRLPDADAPTALRPGRRARALGRRCPPLALHTGAPPAARSAALGRCGAAEGAASQPGQAAAGGVRTGARPQGAGAGVPADAVAAID